MLGSGGYSEVGTKRQRMMESNPYFAVSTTSPAFPPFPCGGGRHPPPFPVVRLRGLPFNCTDLDILKFFAGLDIVDILLVTKNGRFSGEAFVVFSGATQVDFALQRDRQNMGRRYVEVFKCKKQDYYIAVASEVNGEGINGDDSPSRSKKVCEKEYLLHTEILKMRGLPFAAKKAEIAEFFRDYKVVEDGVCIVSGPDGKSTGEAYVEFASATEARRAMAKNKMVIGSRYVELFPATPEEARKAESRSKR